MSNNVSVSAKYDWNEWKETAEANGIRKDAFKKRIKMLGWSHEKAATQPLKQYKKVKTVKEMQIYTVFKHHDPVFTGLAQACADYLQVDQEHIWDKSRINGCIIFEVE